MNDFSKRLKELRAKKGISQEDMAKSIGVHVTHLSRYERGLSVPSLEVAEKIANTFNVSIDLLVYGNQDTVAQQSIKDRELLNMFNTVQKFDDKQKDTVKDLISAFILKSNLKQQLAV